ncbi:MAG: hypothetical protein WCE21_02935 [Candidatus Babeliales bacterium]
MSITKRLLAILLISCGVRAQELTVYGLDNAQLIHHKDNFYVVNDEITRKVHNWNMDAQLRNMNKSNLNQFATYGYITASKMSNGEYTLKAHGRLNGGGANGAYLGFVWSKAATHLAAQGAILGVSFAANFFVPGSQMIVQATLASYAGPSIELLSNAMGIAGGIVLAVETGPV